MNNLAKNQVSAVFHSRVICRSVTQIYRALYGDAFTWNMMTSHENPEYEYRVALCYGFVENTSQFIRELFTLPEVFASQPSKSIFIHRPLSQYCGLILTCRAMIGWGSFVIFLSSTYFPTSSLKRD